MPAVDRFFVHSAIVRMQSSVNSASRQYASCARESKEAVFLVSFASKKSKISYFTIVTMNILFREAITEDIQSVTVICFSHHGNMQSYYDSCMACI